MVSVCFCTPPNNRVDLSAQTFFRVLILYLESLEAFRFFVCRYLTSKVFSNSPRFHPSITTKGHSSILVYALQRIMNHRIHQLPFVFSKVRSLTRLSKVHNLPYVTIGIRPYLTPSSCPCRKKAKT